MLAVWSSKLLIIEVLEAESPSTAFEVARLEICGNAEARELKRARQQIAELGIGVDLMPQSSSI